MNLGTDNQQPTWRYWGEEKNDGSVYTVYLKKVRYFNPSKSVSSDSEDEIAHLEWETVRVRVVKAGTLERLVEALVTDTGELDSTYFNIFLATYRSFATTSQVLTLILDRYKELNDYQTSVKEAMRDQTLKTLRLALSVWLDTHPEDFRDSPNYSSLRQLMEFASENMIDNELELRARHRLEKFLKEDDIPVVQTKDDVMALLINGESSMHFLDIPTRHFAEQLTYIDADLFKKVNVHHCLGSVWSRRDKSRNTEALSVVATVDQFNAVSYRVISTILCSPEIKPTARAKIISKWIDIAQELRVLKNFSSLKAIISGLQYHPVYRLKKVWLAVPREKSEVYEELARIFSEDNNQSAARELLMKEGTAKVAETAGQNDRHLQKIIQKELSTCGTVIQGTVPYLGTFLTDLTMIDTAIPDTISDGLINFDKRRKEFEVLAQIKLLQSAANSYHITADPKFLHWFNHLLTFDDKESNDISYQIEPQSSGGTPKEKKGFRPCGPGHKKNDSIASTSSSCSSQFFDQISDVSVPSSPNEMSSLERKMSTSSSSSSLPSLDVSLSSGGSNNTQSSPYKNPEFYIIKVSVSTPDRQEIDGINLYKSIMLSNSERTPTVIRNAMMKHGLEGNPKDYTLAQLLPDGEMLLPCNANVYYAINTAFDLNFVLRLRTNDDFSSENKKSKLSKVTKKLISGSF